MVNDDMEEQRQHKARAEKIRVAVQCCPGRVCHASISHNRTSFTMQRPKSTLKKLLGGFEKIFDEADDGEQAAALPPNPPFCRIRGRSFHACDDGFAQARYAMSSSVLQQWQL